MSFRKLSRAFQHLFKETDMRKGQGNKGFRRNRGPRKGEPFEKTLSEFEEWGRAQGYAPKTLRGYVAQARQLGEWLGSKGLVSYQALTPALLGAYQAVLAARPGRKGPVLSPSTRASAVSAFLALGRFLLTSARLATNPARDLSFPREPRRLPDNLLTVRDMERLLSTPSLDRPDEIRNRALMELLYATGLRQTEALDLKVDDVDLVHREVRVRRGKGGRGRIVPLCRETAQVLCAYLSDARPALTQHGDSGLFFVSRSGTRLDPSGMLKAFKRYARQAGISRPVGFHTFRHSVATYLMQRGAGIRTIQELLGHRSILATQIYTRVSIPDLKAAHAKYHPRERMEL
jgi:integrase/recombinase XerD